MEAVERIIQNVREKYAGKDVYEICEKEGIIIHRAEMQDDCEGFYLPLEEGRVILLRADLPSQVEREVIAHELYHHFAGVNEDFQSTEGRKFLEIVPYFKEENHANAFAVLLLCPDITDCSAVVDIMYKYDCSKVSAKLRRKLEEQMRAKGMI